jgi:hypothetical protein
MVGFCEHGNVPLGFIKMGIPSLAEELVAEREVCSAELVNIKECTRKF